MASYFPKYANPARATGLCPRGKAGYHRGMTDTAYLEEKIAHLMRSVDDLSDIVARQQMDIALLTRRVAMLMEREAAREMDTGGTIPLADQRPPHW
jgi:SlyX protein